MSVLRLRVGPSSTARLKCSHLCEICRNLETGECLGREDLERPVIAFGEDRDDWTVLIMVVSKDIEDPVPETVKALLPHSEVLEVEKKIEGEIAVSR